MRSTYAFLQFHISRRLPSRPRLAESMRSKSINGLAWPVNNIHFHWLTSSPTANSNAALLAVDSRETMEFNVTPCQVKIGLPSYPSKTPTNAARQEAEPATDNISQPHDATNELLFVILNVVGLRDVSSKKKFKASRDSYKVVIRAATVFLWIVEQLAYTSFRLRDQSIDDSHKSVWGRQAPALKLKIRNPQRWGTAKGLKKIPMARMLALH